MLELAILDRVVLGRDLKFKLAVKLTVDGNVDLLR